MPNTKLSGNPQGGLSGQQSPPERDVDLVSMGTLIQWIKRDNG